jgi:hypothetical protein
MAAKLSRNGRLVKKAQSCFDLSITGSCIRCAIKRALKHRFLTVKRLFVQRMVTIPTNEV